MVVRKQHCCSGVPGSLGLGVLVRGRDAHGDCTWLELVLDVQESSNELEVCQCEWQVLVVTHSRSSMRRQIHADLFCVAPVLP